MFFRHTAMSRTEWMMHVTDKKVIVHINGSWDVLDAQRNMNLKRKPTYMVSKKEGSRMYILTFV